MMFACALLICLGLLLCFPVVTLWFVDLFFSVYCVGWFMLLLCVFCA